MSRVLDVYDWILSPEIRDHMRAKYPLSIEEKIHILCGGFRSIEEKEAAFKMLLEEAGEKRGTVEIVLRLYRLALEELRKSGPEHLFVLPAVHKWSGKTDSLVTCDAALYSSFAELLEHAEDICAGPHLCASKWECVRGKWEPAITFDVQPVNGVYCATRFWPSDEKGAQWGMDEDAVSFPPGNEESGFEWLRYPVPFQTGDLVKLDAPMFEEPQYGVLADTLDLNGTRYMWFGYVNGDLLDVRGLSCNLLHYSGGYRVIDWLHSARPEELPKKEQILMDISAYLRRRFRRGSTALDMENEFLAIFGEKRKAPETRIAEM